MNLERTKYRSKLVAKEFDLKKLEARIVTLRDTLRELLDPFVPIKDLRGEQITDHALEFAMLQIEYNQTAAEIKSIKEALEG